MRKPIPIAVAAILALLVLVQGSRVTRESLLAPADEAADVLPVYLATVTLAGGGDPASREALQASYEARGLRARAATYSTLYPATLPALLHPTAGLSWPSFVGLWRGGLLLALLGCGLAGAFLRPLAPWARVVAPGAGVGLLLLLPASGECVRLGQINMLLALLMGLAMLGMARRWGWLAGSSLALGTAAKLVPGLLVLPLLAARRWKAVVVAAAVGLMCVGVAMVSLPFGDIVEGVVQTARFQAAIHPDWSARHARPADWLAFLATLRHGPLLLLTLALGLPVAALRSREALLAAMALCSAWLGCTASAFHMLYLPLLYPALLWVVLWPLEREAPLRRAIPASVAVLLASAMAFLVQPDSVVLEARMSLLGFGVWGACAVRVAWTWRGAEQPAHPWARMALRWYPAALALLFGALLAGALPANRPLAPPVPPVMQDEIEVGFIRPGDPAPGPAESSWDGTPSSVDHRRTGQWPGVAVGGTLLPGSHGAVAEHLELSRATWEGLADDPELGPWAAWVLEATPAEVLHEQLAADTLRWLVREGLALEAHPGEPRLDGLRGSHLGLLSGEIVPERERRSLGD